MLTDTHFLNLLNPPQLEAVMHLDGPLLVLAGAGTGKTRVLVSRVANIIEQGKAYPSNILAVTFTNKAASEMHSRISNAVSCGGLNIGTFHSIASRILRSHANRLDLGLSSNFTIIAADDQLRLVKDLIKTNNIDSQSYPPKIILNTISRWKDQGILPPSVSESDLKTPIQRIASNLYIQYQRVLLASNAVDFGDLLLYNNQLFIHNPDILESYQDKFRYILIDEYQDTNAVQYVWARMLASKYKNICCVGDDDQSIYSWRGAEIGNILRFSKDFSNAKVITLEQNYRSSSEILCAASSLIQNNKKRHGKVLWTDNSFGEKIKVISCWNDKEEARYVASEIEKAIISNKYKAGDIAILVRAGFQTRMFEEVFMSNAIPYRIIGGFKFYERMEIRDLLAYIRITLNPNDNLALERIINMPRRSIGNLTLKQIKDYATENNISALLAIAEMLENNLLKGKAASNLLALLNQIAQWRGRYESEQAADVTKAILNESGYLDMLKQDKSIESQGRIENLNEMLSVISEFGDIREFVEHSSLVMENEIAENNFGGSVNVMTLHAAKGLEFDLVFLPGMEEGIFPHQKALNDEGEKGLEEERRIAYVGITRARKDLYITFAQRRRVFHEILYSQPSRFLSEIPPEICIQTTSNKGLNYLGSNHNFSMEIHAKKNASEISNTKPLADDYFPAGSRVIHQTFGNGTVLRSKEDNVEVVFEGGNAKTIKKPYLSLL